MASLAAHTPARLKEKPLSAGAEEVEGAAEHTRPHDLPLRHPQSHFLTRTHTLTLFHLANIRADRVLAVHRMQWIFFSSPFSLLS